MNRLLILFFSLIMLQGKAQLSTLVGETHRFEFHSNYWLNLHHFLQLETLLRESADSSLLSPALFDQLTVEEVQQIDSAISYYQQHLSKEDLRASPYQRTFRQWIITQVGEALETPPDSLASHVPILTSLSAFYKKYLWPAHKASIRRVLQANASFINQYEDTLASQLELLTHSYWQGEKIRVDICYYAKSTSWNLRNRPYTSLYPTHIVMNTAGEQEELKGNWLELLFHEASHHLIGTRTGFVAGTIQDVCRVKQEIIPRGLWHAYLFYFSGKVVQEALHHEGVEDYPLYMQRNGVFRRYIPLLDLHLPTYISGEKTLAEVTIDIVNGLE
ncbi:MAG: hypothetical protein AAF655_27895 [Bacteroidota bacterium]